jgi:uncharacterized protein YdaU (DUF1376 family)
MAKERAPYMPLFGREFYLDENVLVMTLEQEGAYLRLLWLCWQEGSIPDDTTKLAAICKNVPVRKFEKEIWPSLAKCFAPADVQRLVHHKVEALRISKNARSEQRVQAGKLGAEIRWRHDGNKEVTDGLAIAQLCVAHSKSMASEYRIPNIKKKTTYVQLTLHTTKLRFALNRKAGSRYGGLTTG